MNGDPQFHCALYMQESWCGPGGDLVYDLVIIHLLCMMYETLIWFYLLGDGTFEMRCWGDKPVHRIEVCDGAFGPNRRAY